MPLYGHIYSYTTRKQQGPTRIMTQIDTDQTNVKQKINTDGDIMIKSMKLALGLHRLEKYLNLEGFLEKSLKIKSALKSTGKSLKGLEKSLNSSSFCRT